MASEMTTAEMVWKLIHRQNNDPDVELDYVAERLEALEAENRLLRSESDVSRARLTAGLERYESLYAKAWAEIQHLRHTYKVRPSSNTGGLIFSAHPPY